MRLFLFASALLVLLSACQSAPQPAPAALPVRMLDHAAQIEMAPPEGYAFSRDGRTLIFSANDGGAMKAFSIPLTGGEPTALASTGDTHVLSYFPGDDRVLLRVGAHLVVRERDETTRDLGLASFLTWCADGSAAVAGVGGLYRLDTTSYERRLVLPLPEERVPNTAITAVSRDCRWAAITTSLVNAIYLADLSAPQPSQRQILQHAGDTTYSVLGFTPTNQSLIYSQRQGSGFAEAYRYALADGQNYPVMQTQADVLAITFSPTGHYGAYYSGAHGNIADAAIVDQTSEEAVPLFGGTRDLRFTRDETKIAFRLANDGWPNDIFIADVDGDHIARLVHAPSAH